ncbi:MAG TPA: RNA polymerase sigma factor [Nitrospiria bacterium]|nr:RNA polymerase sigma factor [Nitrospiria bacterium]
MMDRSKLENLYLNQFGRLRAFLAARVACRETASELAQEAFVRLLLMDPGQKILNWPAFLNRIARNLAIDYHRARLRLRERVLQLHECGDLPSNFPGPEEVAAGRQTAERLSRAIDAMPSKCRRIFIRHKFHGRSHAEIATEYGISRSAVEKHLIRALISLRRAVG